MADYKEKTNWLPDDPITEDDLNRWEQGIAAANKEGDDHRNNKQNPHGVTKAQLALGNVENVRQASKLDFDNHRDDKQNPHNVTKGQTGLGNVQNYPVATQAQAEAGTHSTSYMTPLRTKDAINLHNVDFLKHVTGLGLNAFSADSDPSEYPFGISFFFTDSSNLDFLAQHVFVTTHRDTNSSGQPRLFQTAQAIGNAYGRVWTRGTRSGAWGAWSETESVEGAQSKVNAHENKKNNPHNVNKSQVGLGNVDNVQQAPKTDFDKHNQDETRHITKAERDTWTASEKNAKDASVSKKGDTMTGDLILEAGTAYKRIGVRREVNGDLVESLLVVDATGTAEIRQSVNGTPVNALKLRKDGAILNKDNLAMETSNGAQGKVNVHELKQNNPHKVTTEQINISSSYSADEPGSSYPNGISMFQTASGVVNGFPVNQIIVHTIRKGAHRCFQYVYDASQSLDKVWFRTWRLDNGWRDFVESETVAGAQQKVDRHEGRKDNPHNVTSDQVNVISSKPALDSASTYPTGISLHFISSHSNNVDGYPFGFGTVQTNRVHNSRTFQIFTGNGDRDDSKHSWTRWAFENTWSEWVKMESSAESQAKADKAESNAKSASVSKTGDSVIGALTLNRGAIFGTAYTDVIGSLYRRASEDDLRARMARGWVSLETTDGAAAKVKAHTDLRNNPHNVTSDQVNVIGFKLAAELASTYPVGVSLFAISSQSNNVTGYPFGYGTIQTNRIHNSRTFQTLTGNGDTLSSRRSWIRWAFENNWTDWYEEGQLPLTWLRASLLNRWEQNGSRPVEYTKDSSGNVHIEGAMRNGIYGDPEASAFVLPEGFRPRKTRVINVASASGVISYTRVVIRENGTVWVEDVSRAGAESYVDMSLTFPANR